MTPSVDIDDVTLTYRAASGGVLALQGTSLIVPQGEFAAVVGPSGCGKSSLMKLVTGLLPPDSGQIVIFGNRVRGPVKIAGMAFQNPNLLPWRTVTDNVLLPLEIVEPHRKRFRQNRAQYRGEALALLKTVGLDGFGGVDMARLAKSIDQIALTYEFKNRPKPEDVFTSTYLPPASERKL